MRRVLVLAVIFAGCSSPAENEIITEFERAADLVIKAADLTRTTPESERAAPLAILKSHLETLRLTSLYQRVQAETLGNTLQGWGYSTLRSGMADVGEGQIDRALTALLDKHVNGKDFKLAMIHGTYGLPFEETLFGRACILFGIILGTLFAVALLFWCTWRVF